MLEAGNLKRPLRLTSLMSLAKEIASKYDLLQSYVIAKIEEGESVKEDQEKFTFHNDPETIEL